MKIVLKLVFLFLFYVRRQHINPIPPPCGIAILGLETRDLYDNFRESLHLTNGKDCSISVYLRD